MKILLNGKILSANHANITPINEGLMYGYGLFETIKVYKSKIFFLEEHLNRLILGCKILNMSIDINKDTIEKYCIELIRENNLMDGGIRLTCIKEYESYNLLMTTRENVYTEEKYCKGFKVGFASTKRNPHSLLVGVKSNNYLENILALNTSKEKGFDECIFLNVKDKISEGAISNLFFVKDNEVFTPSKECGLLQGIIRKKVIDIIKKIGLNITEGEFDKKTLYDADEIFLTNSLMNIMPVSQIESTKFNIDKYSIVHQLIAELNKLYI